MQEKIPHTIDNNQIQIERFTFSGGGACGIVNAGVYHALLKMGLLKKVMILSGASAGSATAALMATGMSLEIFRKKILSTDLRTLMGTRVGSIFFNRNPTGVTPITRDGAPLLRYMRKNIVESIRKRLFTREEMTVLGQNNPEFVRLLEKLKDEKALANIHNIAAENGDFRILLEKLKGEKPIVTFRDLALLNHYFPEYFKQLTLPAVRHSNGRQQIFSHVTTPDVEIAMACRASMSLPILLKPVKINVNGEDIKFVDGGLYDNLPTDTFDLNAQNEFISNQKSDRTLVFAFASDYVSETLHGHRWDEVISEEHIKNALIPTINFIASLRGSTDQEALQREQGQSFLGAIKNSLENQVRNKTLSLHASEAIMAAAKKAFEPLLSDPHQHSAFWIRYNEGNSNERTQLLVLLVKKQLTPHLLRDLSYMEIFKRDYAINLFGGLRTDYRNTTRMETVLQRLRTQYPLRTVPLYVGSIDTTDFDEATRLARLMDVMGFLDTINYVTNHELQDKEVFNEEEFYAKLLESFTPIYKSILLGSGKSQNSSLNQQIELLKEQLKNKPTAIVNRQIYYLIKDQVEKDPDSIEAFSLTRAIELNNKTLKADDLFKEVYEEAFKQSGFFSLSNITNHSIFKRNSLHTALKNQNMFALYEQRESKGESTRTNKIFNSLMELNEFKEGYETFHHEKSPKPH